MSERRNTETIADSGAGQSVRAGSGGSSALTLSVRTGGSAARVLAAAGGLLVETPVPLLAGAAAEVLAVGGEVVRTGDYHLLRRPGGLAGVALGHEGEPPRAAARRLYTALLKHTSGLRLHRVWNFVPGINETAEADGLENYRAFNAGRHDAFCENHGPRFREHLPAASALGVEGGRMMVLFSAGTEPARHFENPDQIPAFDYPGQWGELPPAFARGTRVEHAAGTVWHLSGTASIKGHNTRGETFAEQMDLTLENVRLMRARMAVPEDARCQWKIFLRRAEDLPAARAAFAAEFSGARHQAMFLHTGICRSCLLVEIEGAFHQV